MPRRSRAPSSENTVTTAAFTTKTAIAAWTNIWSRSPRRIVMIPARPPRKTYVANSSEPPFTAPAMIATMDMTTIASDASSRIARSIPIAAVGRKYGRTERPAVTLRAIVAPATSSPMSTSTLSRCQSPGRKRHSQPSRIPTSRTPRIAQPTKVARSGPGRRSARAHRWPRCRRWSAALRSARGSRAGGPGPSPAGPPRRREPPPGR